MSINTTLEVLNAMTYQIPVSPKFSKFLGENGYRLMAFQQMWYKWQQFGRKAYYTFSARNNHDKYVRGQSWQEILCVSRSKFEGAVYGSSKDKGFATKMSKELAEEMGFSSISQAIKALLREGMEREHLVILYTDSNNLTWHFFNERLFNHFASQLVKNLKEEAEKENSENLEQNKVKDDLDYVFKTFYQFNEQEGLEAFMEEEPYVRPDKVKAKRTAKQDNFLKGHNMPANFKITDNEIIKAVEMGFDANEVREEAESFYFNYKYGKYRAARSQDWAGEFLHNWLTNSYGFGKIKKHGKYKDGEQKRLSQVDIYRASVGMFDDVTD